MRALDRFGAGPIAGALLATLLAAGATAGTKPVAEPETVVLLHGLGRGPWAMKLLEWRLVEAGFSVCNVGYPRRADSIDRVVTSLEESALPECRNAEGSVHFVTHSLGGLVARAYLARNPLPNLGRVVMLAPPNGGSEIVDHFEAWSFFRALFGPLALRLGTGPGDLPATLPEPDYEVGVIAGDRWINPVGPFVFEGAHDGTVSVERTIVPGMRDHLVVPHTHTFIMNSSEVTRQVIRFLRTGAFAHDGDGAA